MEIAGQGAGALGLACIAMPAHLEPLCYLDYGHADGSLQIVTCDDRKLLVSVPSPHDRTSMAAVSEDGAHLVTGGKNGVLAAWRFDITEMRLRLVRHMTGHRAAITAINVSHRNDILVSASVDGTALVWQLGTGRLLWETNMGGGTGSQNSGKAVLGVKITAVTGDVLVVREVYFSSPLTCIIHT